MKRIHFTILAFLLAAFAGQGCKDKDPLVVTGNVQGTVRDFGTHQALSGVTVAIVSNAQTTFVKQSTTTGSDGAYGFDGIEAGSYNVSFSRSGYVDNGKDVNVQAGKTVLCDATLQTDPDFEIVDGVLTAYHGQGGNVVIPENAGIVSIGRNVFQSNSKVISVTIPEGVISIEIRAFEACGNLVSVNIPSSVKNIDALAFQNCGKLSSAAIPDGVATIGGSAFYSCHALLSVTIPNSVTTIGLEAYSYCQNVKSLSIGSGVVQIGLHAFYGCAALSSVTVSWITPPKLLQQPIFTPARLSAMTLYIPAGTRAAYEADDPWGSFGTIAEY